MKVLKIILNVILSLWMPGAVLLSKGLKVGYLIFPLFLALLTSSLYPPVLHDFFKIAIFFIVWISLFIASNCYYLSNLKARNNRKAYFAIVAATICIQVFYLVVRRHNEDLRLKDSDSPTSISSKIKILEDFLDDQS